VLAAVEIRIGSRAVNQQSLESEVMGVAGYVERSKSRGRSVQNGNRWRHWQHGTNEQEENAMLFGEG
jgi:hypothetical protein